MLLKIRRSKEKIFSILYILSLFLFLLNYLFQGEITFNYSDLNGLILKMNWPFWLGYSILIILIIYQFINLDRINEKFIYLTLILLTVYLIGTPIFYEYLPRFEDTWTHSFLANEMFRSGKVVNNLSYYEQFPGGFLFFGLLFQILSPFVVMKLFPLFLHMFGMITIFTLFKHLINKKISFMASVFYIFFNWTVEDNHLSPQFLVLNLYLVFMLVLIKMLTSKEVNKKDYIAILMLLIPVIVFSHPGTPLFLMLILISTFIICKKFRTPTFIFVIIFLVVFFLFYNINQSKTFESNITYIKKLIEVISTGRLPNMAYRFGGAFIERYVFLANRAIITALSIFLGSAGIFYMHKRKFNTAAKFFFSWSFSILLFVLFVGLVLRGEYYERFVMISSLPLAAAGAYFLGSIKLSKILLIPLLIFLSVSYFIAKYGNEAFESVSSEKLRADCFYYTSHSYCEEAQGIVDTRLYTNLDDFGNTYFHMSREKLMFQTTLLNKNLEDVIGVVDGIASNLRLDRIYSNYNAWIYR